MFFALILTGVFATFLSLLYSYRRWKPPQGVQTPPISVGYHLTRQCNYSCGFCFHTAKTSYVETPENAKRGLSLLKQAGMKKLNFAGGEPFLASKLLGELAKYSKEVLCLESVSVVTNGSKVTSEWLSEYGRYLDVMAVSCDSFHEETNIKIGRGEGTHLEMVRRLSRMCKKHGIKLKINTVVNRHNFKEDMNQQIQEIAPFRWKVFQVLLIEGENHSEETLRDVRSFLITDEEFNIFCDAHKHNEFFVPEPNDVMRSSYLLLDEYMRFMNKGVGEPTKSILDIGVAAALKDVYWDEESFEKRGGVYDWARLPETAVHETKTNPEYDW